jgi:pimeloyl-ACP methyl ester carboxylesterase
MGATSERTVILWNGAVNAHVKVAGQGPALVYLHDGYGLIWDECLDLLARDFTVYAPEHPGTSAGDPDAVKPLDDLWDLVLYYYELFDKLGLESPPLMGHDAPIKNYMVMPQAQLDSLLFADANHPARKLVFMNPEQPDSVIRVTWNLGCTGKFIWPLPDKGLRKRIHRVAAPTLIIWGKQDALTPPVYAEEFKTLIPHARVEMIDKAGHMAPLEQPATIAQMVRDFVKG